MAKYMTYMPGETINICTWLKQTNNTYLSKFSMMSVSKPDVI